MAIKSDYQAIIGFEIKADQSPTTFMTKHTNLLRCRRVLVPWGKGVLVRLITKDDYKSKVEAGRLHSSGYPVSSSTQPNTGNCPSI